jgi:hypothetical protein
LIDAYFAPLAGLKLRPETELYLGLVHRDDMAGNAGASAILRPLQGRNTDRSMKASCNARPHHTLGSKRAGRIRSSLLIEPEAFLRAKQSNPSPVQIPPWIAAALGASR